MVTMVSDKCYNEAWEGGEWSMEGVGRDDQALANQGRLLVGGNTYILKAEPELTM